MPPRKRPHRWLLRGSRSRGRRRARHIVDIIMCRITWLKSQSTVSWPAEVRCGASRSELLVILIAAGRAEESQWFESHRKLPSVIDFWPAVRIGFICRGI